MVAHPFRKQQLSNLLYLELSLPLTWNISSFVYNGMLTQYLADI